MSAVLGISAYYHDAAAALVVDGRVVAAIQEERLSRLKNDPSLPHRAAHACLAQGGITAADLDRVVFYESPHAKIERILVSMLRSYPRAWRQFPRAIASQLGSKIWVVDQIAEMLAIPRQRVGFGNHHRSHAASTFFASPFERAAVLTVDGVGEDISAAIWLGDGTELRCLGSIAYPHSLGLLYAALTAYVGFEVNEGEYKVMGLSAFGKPRFRAEFARLFKQGADGSFELDLPYFAHHTDIELGFGRKLEALLGPRRAPGRPWDLGSDEDRRYADVAATLQQVTEEALVALAREARRRTGCDALCLAGGVALNAVANARILREAGFSRLFVQPAAGDAGGALGAAYIGAVELGDGRPVPLESAAFGQAISTADARALADQLGVRYRAVPDPANEVADLLARGKIVAMARGRFEWGPRALGQRSILALPKDPATRDRINKVIKRREPFRPFAPAVQAAAADTWFETGADDMTPYMTTVANVRPERAGDLGAVTHVDGTARLQTVTAASAPDLHAIIAATAERTGIPVVLNTSFNGPGEPIVAGAPEALAFFMSHSIDALLLGDILIERGAA